MNETYYVKTEEKEHTVKIQNEDEKFYSYDAELVEDPTGTLVEKTITENGEYLPSDDDADGYSKVTVNTPIKTLIEKSITVNGEYLPASDNADGYSKVTVNVPPPVGSNKLASFISKTLTTLTADDLAGATEIGSYTFYYHDEIINMVIPDTVQYIREYAFYECTKLGNTSFSGTFDIGNGIKTIGNYAFYSCGMSNITLPSSVTSIGDYVFRYSNLASITIKAINPPTLSGTHSFDNMVATIYVPAASVEAYKTATNWSTYASRIQAIPA